MNHLKRNSIFIIVLFIAACLSAQLAKEYRYDVNNRWIYDISWQLNYVFGLGSLLYSFIVLIYLLKNDVNLKIKYNLVWIALSLVPILFFAYIIFIGIAMSI